MCGSTYAYRLVWEAANGPLPDGLVLHHLCENVACVRPDHLDPITHAEHSSIHLAERNRGRAPTHCPSGHAYTPDNTIAVRSTRDGVYRQCRTCRVEAARRYRESRRRPA